MINYLCYEIQKRLNNKSIFQSWFENNDKNIIITAFINNKPINTTINKYKVITDKPINNKYEFPHHEFFSLYELNREKTYKNTTLKNILDISIDIENIFYSIIESLYYLYQLKVLTHIKYNRQYIISNVLSFSSKPYLDFIYFDDKNISLFLQPHDYFEQRTAPFWIDIKDMIENYTYK